MSHITFRSGSDLVAWLQQYMHPVYVWLSLSPLCSDVGGTWNTSGCTTTLKDDLVICECNHLTHFALLLSPGIEV